MPHLPCFPLKAKKACLRKPKSLFFPSPALGTPAKTLVIVGTLLIFAMTYLQAKSVSPAW